MIGANYDTIYSIPPRTQQAAPGVMDNGSGCAVLLMLAEYFSPYIRKLKNTIIFVFYDLREFVRMYRLKYN